MREMDTLTLAQRSERMRRMRATNTKPEMAVRRALFAAGFRYRLHVAGLPGRPDIAFPARRKVIFVHGCFWHRHSDAGCKLARLPKSRLEFWLPKLERNKRRDAEIVTALETRGWRSITIWECELRSLPVVMERIEGFLCHEVH